MSIKHSWLGRSGSSSALRLTRFARVAFFKDQLGKTRSFSCTGGSVRPVRSPDGSCVTREGKGISDVVGERAVSRHLGLSASGLTEIKSAVMKRHVIAAATVPPADYRCVPIDRRRS